jgi:hypothetical protein
VLSPSLFFHFNLSKHTNYYKLQLRFAQLSVLQYFKSFRKLTNQQKICIVPIFRHTGFVIAALALLPLKNRMNVVCLC